MKTQKREASPWIWVPILSMTAVWAALFSTTDLNALVVGALFSWAILWWSGQLFDEVSFDVRPRPLGLLLLVFAFFRELTLSAIAVTREVWRPTLQIKPGIVAIPLEVESELEITVLASLISLTPGTLSLEVTPDRKTLFVHALVAEGEGDDIRHSIRERLEKPVKGAFAPARR